MIYHITTRNEWAQTGADYHAASLTSEGFIHASTREQVLGVARAFYADVPDLLLLCIDESKLHAPVKWEAPAHPDPDRAPPTDDEEQFPHIYGSINRDAVVRVLPLQRDADGHFILPF